MWTALAEAANLSPLVKLVSSYNLFELEKNFLELSKRDQGFAPPDQSHHLLYGKGAINNETDVDSGV